MPLHPPAMRDDERARPPLGGMLMGEIASIIRDNATMEAHGIQSPFAHKGGVEKARIELNHYRSPSLP
jgi:hypothetical protein